MSTCFFFTFDSSAVPVNGLYLEQIMQTNPEKLAKNTADGPEIVGAVYIHPTAQIDPKAKVRRSDRSFSLDSQTFIR